MMNHQEEPVHTAAPPHEESSGGRPKYALLTLRAVAAFLVLAAVIAVLGWVGYNAYPTVATWAESGNREALVYEDATYYRCGRLGDRKLPEKKYTIEKLLGKVKDDGVLPVTEPETLPPEADVEDGVRVDAPKADPTLATKHTYIVYSLKDKENLLAVLERDGEYYVYYREGTENPVAPAQTIP